MTTLQQEHSRDACYFGDRPDWLIVYSQHYDSDTLTRANWTSFLEALGGESDTVAIEHSSHWAVGWVEYLVIDPNDTDNLKLAESIKEKLEDYPVIDETALSQLEWDEYTEGWSDYGASDFRRALAKTFGLSDAAKDALSDCDKGRLQEWFESLIPSGEYYIPEGNGVSINTDSAIFNCQRDDVAQFLRSIRN